MASPKTLAVVFLALLGAACDNGSGSTTDVVPGAPAILMPRPGGTVNSSTVQVELPTIPDAVRYEIGLFGTGVAPLQAPEPVVGDDEVARLSMVAPIQVASSTTPSASFENLANGYYAIQYDAIGEQGEILGRSSFDNFRVLDVQEFFPDTEVVVHEPDLVQSGHRLLCFIGQLGGGLRQLMAIVNLEGEVVWNWEGPEAPGLIMAPSLKSDGSGVRAIRLIRGSDGRFSGWITEVDWDGNITYEAPLPNDADGRRIVPHHELEELPDGRLLYLGWEWREYPTGPGGTMIPAEGDIIQIFNPATNQVDWSWSIFDHYTPLTRPTPEEADPALSGFGTDWSHANGIEWDPTNSIFWMSVRHFDALIGVEFPGGNTVEIGPQGMGGFLFSHQHAPELQADGSILLWDNGNITNPPQPYLPLNYQELSYVRQIEFDLNAQTAGEVFSWTDGFYDRAVGDADRLPNGNILVTHGLQQKLVEIDGQGNKVWELRFTSPLGEPFNIYRSDWIDSALLPAELR